VVGDGELREWAAKRVVELGIAGATHFMGWQQQMEEIYPELDILALTSRNEGLPTVIIEAMAAGVPVVSTRVGSVPDLIAPGEGAVVEPGDVEGIAAGILGLLDRTAETEAMAMKGREKALGLYGTGRMIEDLDGLYRDLLEKEKRG
jgi:glycosyltransferase involved in cell wall biosynthesis